MIYHSYGFTFQQANWASAFVAQKAGIGCCEKLCALFVLATISADVTAQTSTPGEQEIRSTMQMFFDGWNAHDVDKMTSVYADDVDHINVYGVWHKGKAEIRDDISRLHAAGLGAHKDFTIEKIRMIGKMLRRSK
jgi:hypothetical protein